MTEHLESSIDALLPDRGAPRLGLGVVNSLTLDCGEEGGRKDRAVGQLKGRETRRGLSDGRGRGPGMGRSMKTMAGSKGRGEARWADWTSRGADEEPPAASGPAVDADAEHSLADARACPRNAERVLIRPAVGAAT